MSIDCLPNNLVEKYEVYEWRHATAILKEDFPNQFEEILTVIENFVLKKSDILTRGGRLSPIANYFQSHFESLGWNETNFETAILVDDNKTETPTHKIDAFKNRVGIEIEWNNKDPFFDRDLNNFRLLHELRVLSVGIIITRSTELQTIFNQLDKGSSYGTSTTHMEKLKPRIDGGGGAGCPILVFGITPNLYVDDQ